MHVPLKPVSEGLRSLPCCCYLVGELMGVYPVCVGPVLDDGGAFPAEVVEAWVFSGVAVWGCLEWGISAKGKFQFPQRPGTPGYRVSTQTGTARRSAGTGVMLRIASASAPNC